MPASCRHDTTRSLASPYFGLARVFAASTCLQDFFPSRLRREINYKRLKEPSFCRVVSINKRKDKGPPKGHSRRAARLSVVSPLRVSAESN